jgi:hypothetical protein
MDINSPSDDPMPPSRQDEPASCPPAQSAPPVLSKVQIVASLLSMAFYTGSVLE